jgi:polyisoprenoid-binding protein YceI
MERLAETTDFPMPTARAATMQRVGRLVADGELTLDTGIDLRNNHMKDSYLETETHRFAEFTGELEPEFDPSIKTEQQASVTGTFQIHGVEREINVQGTIKPVESGLQLDAGWTVLLEDYNIDKPKVVFYELASEQEINISILLKLQN